MFEIEVSRNSQVERRMYKTVQQCDYWINWYTSKGYKVSVME